MKKMIDQDLVALQERATAKLLLSNLMNVGIVVVLLILSAFVRIPLPFTPVPITAQTLVVLLGGAYLGARLASVALGFYICLGIIGLPIFSGAEGGLGKFLGPTGGYLIGFIAASWFVGKLIDYHEKFIRNSLIFLFASTIILVCGMLYLALYLHVSFRTAFFVGMLPFVPGELIKVAIASGIYRKVKLFHSKKS